MNKKRIILIAESARDAIAQRDARSHLFAEAEVVAVVTPSAKFAAYGIDADEAWITGRMAARPALAELRHEVMPSLAGRLSKTKFKERIVQL